MKQEILKPSPASVKVGFTTATAIVIANMVGTGVFTSLGFQVLEINSVFALLLLWIVGGVVALTGALAYGELVSAYPRSGGEYHFLSKIYHPALGFMAGWVSLLVGFAAPTALAAMALSKYFSSLSGFRFTSLLAVGVVIILSVIHSFNIRVGGNFQKIVTMIKVVLILFFVTAGFMAGGVQPLIYMPGKGDLAQVFSPAFAISLIYVSYSFSGWNASVYISGEVDNPAKNIGKSLMAGTIIVTILYLLLNMVFLYSTPIEALVGKVEVGFISAEKIFGIAGGRIMAGFIVVLLISTISAMIWIGPRVTQMMGEDYRLFGFLAIKNRMEVPVVAIWFQSAITVFLIITSTFEKVLVYSGFILNFFTLLCVAGLFIIRAKKIPAVYRVWGYPFTPIIFIALSLWTLIYLLAERTQESVMGLMTIAAGLVFYWLSKAIKK